MSLKIDILHPTTIYIKGNNQHIKESMLKVLRVESHIFKNNKVLDSLCFKSKNLYNLGLYTFRQAYIKDSKYLFYVDLVKELNTSDAYRDLPAQVAQQTLRMLDKNLKSFFKSLKDWSKNPSKYLGRPKLPKYLDKEMGRFIFINPGQSISRKGDIITFLRKLFSFRTKVSSQKILEVRVVPRLGYSKVEVVYEKDLDLSKVSSDSNRYMGIDLGIDNLAGVTIIDTNRPKVINFSTLVKGTPLKSLNQFYNKRLAELKSSLKKVNNQDWSKNLSSLTFKRNQKIQDYFHKASKAIVSLAVKNSVGTIVIGKNKGWKQEINLGKRTNQKFVSIAHSKFIQMITYKAEEQGIKVLLVEESYTSKVDHLALEPLEKQETYLGKRIKRGLFKSSTGVLLNADINGSLGILRKVVSEDFLRSLANRGEGLSPIKLKIV